MAIDTSGNFVDDDAFWDTGSAGGVDTSGGFLTGRSLTQDQVNAQTQQAIAAGVPADFAADFLGRNPGDSNRLVEAYASELRNRGGGGSASAPVSAASGAPAVPNLAPFSFNPADLGKSEGFKFRYDKAIDAIKKAGAAKGTYFNPQTWKAAESEASGLAAQELDAEFNRQGQTWDRNTGAQQWTFGANRQNRLDDFDIYNTNRNFDRGVLESDREFDFRNRGFDYQKQRDTVDDNWRYIDYGYRGATA